ncbi:MAG: biopolymer transporter ExbD, partial [Gemmatimonadales bacterium]|nr:biopolymer transporter ExbD [Gemmatimonadales bacterium]
EQLETRLKAPHRATRRSVVIKADKRLHYGNVIQVMGICKDSDVLDIGVAIR